MSKSPTTTDATKRHNFFHFHVEDANLNPIDGVEFERTPKDDRRITPKSSGKVPGQPKMFQITDYDPHTRTLGTSFRNNGLSLKAAPEDFDRKYRNRESPDLRIDRAMKNWDLVISIEHCCNCDCHGASLRHDGNKYTGNANAFLRHLSKIVFDSKLRVRLGVLRLNIETEAKVGAFEVFVAFKNRDGVIYHDCLHSKLETKLWPAKKSVEKALQDFLTRMRITKFANDSDIFSDFGFEGVSQYPIGFGNWLETPVADPDWVYPLDSTAADKSGKSQQPLPVRPSQLDMQWVYDSKEPEPFRPVSDEEVCVTGLKTPANGSERFGLVGYLIRYCDDIPLGPEGEYIRVRLKYLNDEILILFSTIVDPATVVRAKYESPDDFPPELVLILLFTRSRRGKQGKGSHKMRLGDVSGSQQQAQEQTEEILADWSARSPTDKVEFNRVYLSRASLFQQLREIVCGIERIVFPHIADSSKEAKTIFHPISGAYVDLQNAYAEGVLDWIFSEDVRAKLGGNAELEYNDLVDIQELENMAGRYFLSKLPVLSPGTSFSPHYAIPLQTYMLRHCLRVEMLRIAASNVLKQEQPNFRTASMDVIATWAIKFLRSTILELCTSLAKRSGSFEADPLDSLHHVVRALDLCKHGSLDATDIQQTLELICPDMPTSSDLIASVFFSIDLKGCGEISVDQLRRFLICRNDFTVEIGLLRPIIRQHMYTVVEASVGPAGGASGSSPKKKPSVSRSEGKSESKGDDDAVAEEKDVEESEAVAVSTVLLMELFADTMLKIAYTNYEVVSHLDTGWERNPRSFPVVEVFGQCLVHFGIDSVLSQESLVLLVWSYCHAVSGAVEQDIAPDKRVCWIDFLTWLMKSDDGPYSDLLHQLLSRAVILLHHDSTTRLLVPINIIWDSPAPLDYGESLSSEQLCARLSHLVAPGSDEEIRGEFRYSPDIGTILEAGTHTLRVVFVPLDSTRFPLMEHSVTLTVKKLSPIITWTSDLGTIEVGDELTEVHLCATCVDPLLPSQPIKGSFFYSRSFGYSFSKTGVHDISVTCIPENSNYAQVSKQANIKVLPKSTASAAMPPKLDPTIIWDDSNNPPLKVGEELGETHLHARIQEEGVIGTFFYSKPFGYIFSKPGRYEITATFVPTEPFDWKYKQVSKSISILVIHKDPLKTMIVWEEPAPVDYGAPITDIQLNAMCVDQNDPTEVIGQYMYSHEKGQILEPGVYLLEVSFYPEDTTAYLSSYGSVNFTVNKLIPDIYWHENGISMFVGSPLTAAELNATCLNEVPGHFYYTRPLGHAYMQPGEFELNMSFMPQDLVFYAQVSKTIIVTVTRPELPASIVWATPEDITFGAALNHDQLNAKLVVDSTKEVIPAEFTYTPELWSVLDAGHHILSVKAFQSPSCELNLKFDPICTVSILIHKLQPFIKWTADLGTIEVGERLSEKQLCALCFEPLSKADLIEGTFFYSRSLGNTFSTPGTHEIIATFVPNEFYDRNYKQATAIAKIEVVSSNIDIEIVWPYPESIEYGTELSSLQLQAVAVDKNSNAEVKGSYLYYPAESAILDAGRTSLNVEFRPHSNTDYLVTKTVELVVNKKMPVLIWDDVPEPIFVGEEVSANQLNAVCEEADGKFVYSIPIGHVFSNAGAYEVVATFYPATGNYYQAVKMAKITVIPKLEEAHAILTFYEPSSIFYGTPLSDEELTARCVDASTLESVPGSYRYNPPPGTILDAGEHSLEVSFAPVDASIYSVLEKTVRITVYKVEPTIIWTVAEDAIVVGVELSEAVLNATLAEDIQGQFFYSKSFGFSFTKAGVYEISVTFVPEDEFSRNYKQVSKTMQFHVRLPDPLFIELAWESPSPIDYGTPLSHVQLCASCINCGESVDISGTFQYFPHLGSVLNAGIHELHVVFNPSDSLKYPSSVRTSVSITVNKLQPVISWEEPITPLVQGQPLTKEYLNAVLVSDDVSGTFLYTPAEGFVFSEGGYQILTVIFFPGEPYDFNYRQASKSVHLLVLDSDTPQLSVCGELQWVNPSKISFGSRLTGQQLNAKCIDREFGTEITGRYEYNPSYGDVLGEGNHSLHVLFFPENKSRYGAVYTAEVQIEVIGPNSLQPDSPPISKYSTGLRDLVRNAGDVVEPAPLFHSRKIVFHRMVVDGRVLKRAKFGDVLVRLKLEPEVFEPIEMYKFDKMDGLVNFHFQSRAVDISAETFLTQQLVVTIRGRTLLKNNKVEFTASANVALEHFMRVDEGPFTINLFAYPKLYLTDVRSVVTDDAINDKCKLKVSIIAHAYAPTFTPTETADESAPASRMDGRTTIAGSGGNGRPTTAKRPSSANAAGRPTSAGGRASYGLPYGLFTTATTIESELARKEKKSASHGTATAPHTIKHSDVYRQDKDKLSPRKLFHSPAAASLSGGGKDTDRLRSSPPPFSPPSRLMNRNPVVRPRSAPQDGKRSRGPLPVVVTGIANEVIQTEIQRLSPTGPERWPETSQGKYDLRLAPARPLPLYKAPNLGAAELAIDFDQQPPDPDVVGEIQDSFSMEAGDLYF